MNYIVNYELDYYIYLINMNISYCQRYSEDKLTCIIPKYSN